MINYRLVVIALSVLLLLAVMPLSSLAQRTTGRVNPTSTIPSPKSFLGFAPGDDRTIADWNQITSYFGQLDKASDRVVVQSLGLSTLKRPLFVAIISARENILALDKYKGIQQQLADPRKVFSDDAGIHLADRGHRQAGAVIQDFDLVEAFVGLAAAECGEVWEIHTTKLGL